MRSIEGTHLARRYQEISPFPGLAIMAAVFIALLLYIGLNSSLAESFTYFYLLPWLLALAVVLVAPFFLLHRQGKLTLYDPIVSAALYLFPAFVIGGLMLVMGWSDPGFMHMIQDPEYNLPYTVVLVMLGYGGLVLGYFFPLGAVVGREIEKILPRWEFEPGAFLAPGVVLLGFGLVNLVVATITGVIGFQRGAEYGVYDGLIYSTTLLWTEAVFLVMYVLFLRKRYDVVFFALSLPIFAVTLLKAAFSGSRGTLLNYVVIVLLAYVLSGARMTRNRLIAMFAMIGAALLAGMIFATMFRDVKGTEERTSADQYAGSVASTVDTLVKTDVVESLTFGVTNIAVRIDLLSSLAVVVSTYEQLAPYEEGFGINDNIMRDLTTFMIPRIFWKDKPIESNARLYSDLYFNYGANSFVITPMGDLLRNFGPIGVPIGMFLWGMILRTVYRALVEGQPRITWRVTLYFMLVTTVSYEWFYATLIPNLIKIGITAVFGLLIIYFSARLIGHKSFTVSKA